MWFMQMVNSQMADPVRCLTKFLALPLVSKLAEAEGGGPFAGPLFQSTRNLTQKCEKQIPPLQRPCLSVRQSTVARFQTGTGVQRLVSRSHDMTIARKGLRTGETPTPLPMRPQGPAKETGKGEHTGIPCRTACRHPLAILGRKTVPTVRNLRTIVPKGKPLGKGSWGSTCIYGGHTAGTMHMWCLHTVKGTQFHATRQCDYVCLVAALPCTACAVSNEEPPTLDPLPSSPSPSPL